jgi:putative ABC transport system permease protein
MSHWKAALRSAVCRPAFTFTTITVLAFGIGANSALFSVIDTVLLKPLPFPEPDRLVQIMEANPATSERLSLISPAHLDDWNRMSQTFEVISGSYRENVTDTSGSEPERLNGRRVAPGFFEALGMPPLVGRTFERAEESQGGPAAAVLSEGLWVRRYQRDPGVIGRQLVLSGTAYTVVGVMPKDFAALAVEVWLPAQFGPMMMRHRDARFLTGIARLKRDATLPQARSDMQGVCQRLGEQYPKTDHGWSAVITDYKQQLVGSNSRALWLMFGSTALLLLILCANIAALFVGQLQRRERELAIRASLGASRKQIVGVVLREVVLVGAISGVLGLAVSWAGAQILSHVFAELPRMQEMRLDWRVGLFTATTALMTAVVFGLAPAMQAMRRDLNIVLSQGGRTQAGGSRRLQQGLVATQFAVTLVLLAGAGLLLRSYYNLNQVRPGFRTSQVVMFHVGAEWGENRDMIGLLQEQLVSELQQLPGVAAAGFTNFLPASGATLREQVSIEGLSDAGDQGKITTGSRTVTGGYLRALQVPLLHGALCPDLRKDAKQAPRILVNRRFAEIAGGRDILGRRLSWSNISMAPREIIGVIGDVREDALDSPPGPYVYACAEPGWWPDPEYVVAISGNRVETVRAIRRLVRRLAPNRAMFGLTTMEEYLARSLDRPRLNTGILSVFASCALLSAALGLYALMSLAVTARTREIGLRMAVGATRTRVSIQVVREAMYPLAAALAAGIVLGVFALRTSRSILFGVAPSDLLTFACACGLLLAVAFGAALVPAARASRIDPMQALRSD